MFPGSSPGANDTVTSWVNALRRSFFVALLVAGVMLVAPTAATPAGDDALVSWAARTPPDGAVLGVAAKTQLFVPLEAITSGPEAIRIRSQAPHGAKLRSVDGNPAKATFTWTPSASQVGRYRITFVAASEVPGVTAERTFVIRVGPPNKPPPGPAAPEGVYPRRFELSDRGQETYRWAFVGHRTVARSGPSRSARALSVLTYRTPELYRNAILMLDGVRYHNGQAWVRVRLAIRPNGSTGWVPRGALAGFQKIHTRMTINQSALRATLYRHGRPVFTARIGVGQPQWPTPRGEFYIREKLSGYYAPAYGPRAFGLNARSNALTDWPGGGFIGIHGTNQPSILPGRVSHGCIRMRNASIMRLFRLMPLGTPVTIQ
jgi:hypothetical protein